ncbi:MAG TPA: hypothetical protein VK973_09625, partial [Arenicellales bacterium]|nr:hypothetical protein [Arenicellales bacterium]
MPEIIVCEIERKPLVFPFYRRTLIVGENRMTGKILYLSRFHAKPVPTAWSEDAGYQRRIVWLAEIFAG